MSESFSSSYEYVSLSSKHYVQILLTHSVLSWAFRFGDLTKELSYKVKEGVQTFTGKPEWELGDIAKTVVKRLSELDEEGDQVSGIIGS